MTLSTNQFTLGTVAQMVCPPDIDPQRVYLHNHDHNNSKLIYFGNENVSIVNAPHLDPGDSVYLTLNRGESLYAISDPSGAILGVLQQKTDR